MAIKDYVDISGDYVISHMTRDEIDIAISWAESEGWNPGIRDGECFWSADPNGFFIGVIDREPVATISAVAYDDAFGFLGFYIVKPEHRGHGYGTRIWKVALNYLGARNIGADGVLQQLDNYIKWGFNEAYHTFRYQGKGGGECPSDLIGLHEIPFDELNHYDSTIFPASRSTFLQCWIHQPEGASCGLLQDGRLLGYGVIRKCGAGYKIGPLFADDEMKADVLLRGLLSQVPDEPVFIDCPDINPAAIAMAKRYDMKAVFETARIYNCPVPNVPMNKVFGVTTLELG